METITAEHDLYTILVRYSSKSNSPYVKIDSFLSFLGKYAEKAVTKDIGWAKWTKGREVRFWAEINDLAEAGKCELVTEASEGRIFIPHYFPEQLRQYYDNIESATEHPFPIAEAMGEIPPKIIMTMGVESELIAFLKENKQNELPILRINFPEGLGHIVVLSEFLPQRLSELCLCKISHYLKERNNKEFVYHKMIPQLAGKEIQIRSMLDRIVANPLECYSSISGGGEFPSVFWNRFGFFIKADYKSIKDPRIENTNAVQAACILDSVSSFFKNQSTKMLEKEYAMKDLENQLKKPPYLFNFGEIIKFTNSGGISLLNFYTNEELESTLKKMSTSGENDELPPLLIVKEENETWFVAKSTMFYLCARMLIDARDKINNLVTKRWQKIIQEYDNEPAMESDRELDRLLEQYTRKYYPLLSTILSDPKLPIVYDEIERAGNDIPLTARIVSGGRLLPYTQIFMMKRKDLIDSIKLNLPFWYSIPFLMAIIAFFKRPSRQKIRDGIKNVPEAEATPGEAATVGVKKNPATEIRNAAIAIQKSVVPEGSTIDKHISDLESRWCKLMDGDARKNLVQDVKSLTRDSLRRTLRLNKAYKVTRKNLTDLADTIVQSNPTLKSIGEDEALTKYIEIYLVKLLVSHGVS